MLLLRLPHHSPHAGKPDHQQNFNIEWSSLTLNDCRFINALTHSAGSLELV